MRRTTLLEDYRRRLVADAHVATAAEPSLFLRNAALLGLLGALYGGAFLLRSAQLLPW